MRIFLLGRFDVEIWFLFELITSEKYKMCRRNSSDKVSKDEAFRKKIVKRRGKGKYCIMSKNASHKIYSLIDFFYKNFSNFRANFTFLTSKQCFHYTLYRVLIHAHSKNML